MKTSVGSPVGRLTLIERAGALSGIRWGGGGGSDDSPLLAAAAAQLAAYFAGDLAVFDLPLAAPPSDAQAAWRAACLTIPFGETRTYGEVARDIGWPAQAVGAACGGNPIPIVVPCHRVLAADSLGGFSGAGGIEAKVALLRHEGAASLLI